MTQPSLFDVNDRRQSHKIARSVSRAQFLEAEARGQIRGRDELVYRTLRYFWNTAQRSVTSKHLARWIQKGRSEWRGREWAWILLETRRGLDDLRKKGLADTQPDKIGREFLWRFREQGTGERRVW